MKKFVLALTALTALAASPAMARSDTHISIGLFSPTPVYYEPAPVYYPPVQYVYYAPRPFYGYRHGHDHRGWDRHHKHHGRGGWNAPRGHDYDDDRGGEGRRH